VEIARQPTERHRVAFKSWESELTDLSPLARLLLPNLPMLSAGFTMSQARLRSAIAALAVERYHREHANWPRSLDQLAQDFLAGVPTDPFDGRPLRYRLLDDGVVIYAIVKDGRDGGLVDDSSAGLQAPDIGIRLRDPHRRRRLPTGPRSEDG
jgi:hypothetical protein